MLDIVANARAGKVEAEQQEIWLHDEFEAMEDPVSTKQNTNKQSNGLSEIVE